jgi:hypothetical protein
MDTQTNLGRRAGETSLIIQAELEGLNPQQVLTRNLLVELGLLPYGEADELVRKMGSTLSAELRVKLKSDGDPLVLFREFAEALPAS